jgi:hypothetical protein
MLPLLHGCTLASLLLYLGTGVVANMFVGARQSCRSCPPRVLIPGAATLREGLRVHFLLRLASPAVSFPKGFLVIPPLGCGGISFSIPCVWIARTSLCNHIRYE